MRGVKRALPFGRKVVARRHETIGREAERLLLIIARRCGRRERSKVSAGPDKVRRRPSSPLRSLAASGPSHRL